MNGKPFNVKYNQSKQKEINQKPKQETIDNQTKMVQDPKTINQTQTKIIHDKTNAFKIDRMSSKIKRT